MDTLRKLHAFPFANRQYIAEHLQDKGNFGKRIWKKKRNRSFMNNLFLYKIYGFWNNVWELIDQNITQC